MKMISDKRFQHILLTFLTLFQLLFAQASSAVTIDEIQASLLDQLGYSPSAPYDTEKSDISMSATSPQIIDVYRENGFEPLWVDIHGPNRNAAVLFKVLKASPDEGLNPEDYHTAEIESKWPVIDSKELATLDILLTTALHSYVSDVREGRLDPCLKNPDLFTCARDRRIDPVALTAQAMAVSDLDIFLQNQAPDGDQYRNLRNVLKQYREIEKIGGWKTIPEGPILKPGMTDPRVPLIRYRLAATWHMVMDAAPVDPSVYDDEVVAAVKQFQEKYGLKVDGIFGEATRSAMNVSVADLIRRIIINMERLRWLSRGAGKRHVMVNIASFRLVVIENAQIILEMPVIVGKSYRETPVFSDLITYIEFNPFWNIPPSIAKKDILPKLKTDPSYLTSMGIRVFEGWRADSKELDPLEIRWDTITRGRMATFKLRQDPGPKNFLGRVKFMFPNRFAVYLHDTPSQELFQRTVRMFSSGCIRVGNPLELAEYLLEENKKDEWKSEKIRQTVDSGIRTVVKLKTPVPIHIVYLTAYTDSDGCVCFKKDIYGRDELLEKALFESTS